MNASISTAIELLTHWPVSTKSEHRVYFLRQSVSTHFLKCKHLGKTAGEGDLGGSSVLEFSPCEAPGNRDVGNDITDGKLPC